MGTTGDRGRMRPDRNMRGGAAARTNYRIKVERRLIRLEISGAVLKPKRALFWLASGSWSEKNTEGSRGVISIVFFIRRYRWIPRLKFKIRVVHAATRFFSSFLRPKGPFFKLTHEHFIALWNQLVIYCTLKLNIHNFICVTVNSLSSIPKVLVKTLNFI